MVIDNSPVYKLASNGDEIFAVPYSPCLASIFSHFKGRVERIFFFASFKLPLFNEYEMVFIIA